MGDWIRQIPVVPLAIISAMLAVAPFNGEPHLLEKLRMLVHGELVKPLDMFDLFLHGTPLIVLILRLTMFRPPSDETS
ncbi:MAG: RND transporter [bacterium]